MNLFAYSRKNLYHCELPRSCALIFREAISQEMAGVRIFFSCREFSQVLHALRVFVNSLLLLGVGDEMFLSFSGTLWGL